MEGIQEVYLRYLHDPRRAIIVGQQLLEEYPQQRASQARAVLRIIEACVHIEQLKEARHWMELAESEYGDVPSLQDQLGRLQKLAADRAD